MRIDWDNGRVAEILVDAMGAYDEILEVDLDGYIIARSENQIDIIDWVITEEPVDVDLDLKMCRQIFEQVLDKCMDELDLPGGCNIGHAYVQIHVKGNKGVVKLMHFSSWDR